VKIRRSATSAVKGYFLPTQLLVAGSWLGFWLSPDAVMPRTAIPWFALLVWMNLQGRLLSYGLLQTAQNTLADFFTWSMAVLLFMAVVQNVVICAVSRHTGTIVLAEKFDVASRIMFPVLLTLFWAMLFITLAGIEGLRSKTPGELNSTFDILEGIFLTIAGLSLLVSTALAVYNTKMFHQRILTLFVDASPHMMTDPSEIAVLFRYIAGRKIGWTAGQRRAYIEVSEIDEALDANGVPDKVRIDVKEVFKKQAREPMCISKQDFTAIWCQLTQMRYEHFKRGPHERDFLSSSPQPAHVPDVWAKDQSPQQPATPSQNSHSPSALESASQQGGQVQQPATPASQAYSPRTGNRSASPRVIRAPPSPAVSTGSPHVASD